MKRNKKGQFVKGGIPHNKKDLVKKKCKQCGKNFFVKPSLLRIKFHSQKCYWDSMKGKAPKYRTPKGIIPWNKGKKWNKETLQKLKGERKQMQGENNHNWKGGISKREKLERIKFRRTIQKEVLKRDDYTCQICGEKGGNLQVDHIQSWSEYVKLRFNMSNCRTVCMECHYKITFGKPMPKNVKTWGHNLKTIERRIVT